MQKVSGTTYNANFFRVGKANRFKWPVVVYAKEADHVGAVSYNQGMEKVLEKGGWEKLRGRFAGLHWH